MNIHEYQAYNILNKYGIATLEYGVATTEEEVHEIIRSLHLTDAVIKAQAHTGGRGKGGGVKTASGSQDILAKAKEILGMTLVTKQTGSEGLPVNKVMITRPASIAHEYYIAATIDRKRGTPIIIASPEGGMDIEEIAATKPEKILATPFSRDGSIKMFQLRNIALFMGWEGDVARQGMATVAGIARAFIESDAALLEINPLIKTKGGNILAIDAKISLDDNALFRHKDLEEYYDATQLPTNEAIARDHDLSYISLDGDIGCMVNGAGLAMATMDLITHHGGKPANFLDVGGGATRDKIAEGFALIAHDPKVKAILVNIFGGIMDCSILAEGLVHAAEEKDIQLPIIVRMEGTNVDKGKEILSKAPFTIITASELSDAAEKAVSASQRQ
jgi:succinyl-CoA synthetase beta subunit